MNWGPYFTKGQIKPELIYEVMDFPNYQFKNVKDFHPKILFEAVFSSTNDKDSFNMQNIWLNCPISRDIQLHNFQGRNPSNF